MDILFIPYIYVSYRLIRTCFALIWAVLLYKIAPLFYKVDLKPYKHRWCVVTGATDGIGKAYLNELAKRGLKKFVIIGRNPDKVKAVQENLESSHGFRVKSFIFDFSNGDYNEIRKFLEPLDIGFVVVSHGIGRENLERYGDSPEADSMILKVNGIGPAEFLSCVLPTMEKNGGGQIVVLSSSQGCRPIPLLAAYSASKALVSFLCEAIDREYNSISVQCLTPALVATKMVYYSKGSLFVVTPEDFAHEAVSTIGLAKITSGSPPDAPIPLGDSQVPHHADLSVSASSNDTVSQREITRILSALLVLLVVKLCRSRCASSPSPSQTVFSSLPTTTDVSFAVSGATFTTSTFEPTQASKFASVRSVDQVIAIDNQRVHKV
ncbi:hypothetical protein WR25_24214 [Diploscapter pachys]|uniref:Uncharacterized protein n=1 Tax=Diploscapter pachys TaxID=2018661 RepID=A0A2A2LLV9_9BILA|nr:hypothetical protein WR25_24214 [Diploscapter pachys]